jgi:DNA-binding NarL/FixJ family response regulator
MIATPPGSTHQPSLVRPLSEAGAGGPAWTVRVVVVDDDPLARRALRAALTSDRRVQVVAEASDSARAVDLVARVRPDVVLVDTQLTDVDGITTAFRMRRRWADVRVVMLSEVEDDELALLALRAGAIGVVAKDVPPPALVRIVVGVAQGEGAITRWLTRVVVERLRELPPHGIGMRPIRSTLTAREWQVLDLLALGRGTDEIAAELVLSTETVRSHVKRILSKLGAHSRAEAVGVAERLRRTDVGWHEQADGEDPEEAMLRRELERLRGRPAP